MAVQQWERELVDELASDRPCWLCGRPRDLVCMGSYKADVAWESICALHLPAASKRWRQYGVTAVRAGRAWAMSPDDLIAVAGSVGPYRVLSAAALRQRALHLLRTQAAQAGLRVPRLVPRAFRGATVPIDAATPEFLVWQAALSGPAAARGMARTNTRGARQQQAGVDRWLPVLGIAFAASVALRLLAVLVS